MELIIRNLSKSYGDLEVLTNVNLRLQAGNIYCLMEPSGSGKTTLFRIILGLSKADSGCMEGLNGIKTAAVFQENRLCEEFTPIENLTMVTAGYSKESREKAKEALLRLLPEESLSRPVFTLSGGMKRRVAIARALWATSDMLLMDEPFTGLDQDTKRTVIRRIMECTKNKLVILSTHQEEDVRLLHGIPIKLGPV